MTCQGVLAGLLVAFTLSFLIMVLPLIGSSELELQDRDDQYCNMVKLNRGDPTLGWPDYKGIYDEVCFPDD